MPTKKKKYDACCTSIINACFENKFDINEVLKEEERGKPHLYESDMFYKHFDDDDYASAVLMDYLVVLGGQEFYYGGYENYYYKCLKLLDRDTIAVDYILFEKVFDVRVIFFPHATCYTVMIGRKVVFDGGSCPITISSMIKIIFKHIFRVERVNYVKTYNNFSAAIKYNLLGLED